MYYLNELFSSCVAFVKENEPSSPFFSPNEAAENIFNLTPPFSTSYPRPSPNWFGIFLLSTTRFKVSLCAVNSRSWLELTSILFAVTV